MTTTKQQLTALLATGAALAVNGLALGPMWLVVPGEFSDTVASPAFVISQRVSWVLLTILVVLIQALAPAGSRPLPGWIVPLVQVAVAAQAAIHFVQGFVLPWLETVAPQVLDLTAGGTLQLTMMVVQVLFLVVIVTFAVTLWRAGHSRAGAVLMIIGAVVIPGVGPIGAGVLGIGLGLMAWQSLRRGAHQSETELTSATV